MTSEQRRIIIQVGERRHGELMREYEHFSRQGQLEFAAETWREHIKPLRDALTAFQTYTDRRHARVVRSDPWDERVNPKTQKAVNGTTTLFRYRVEAVVYAPSITEAYGRISHDIYVDAASVRRG
jgi:hypothetical protein